VGQLCAVLVAPIRGGSAGRLGFKAMFDPGKQLTDDRLNPFPGHC